MSIEPVAGEQGWVLVVYRTPGEPSTARVAAWRRLHRIGGLYVGPSVCLVPGRLAEARALERIAEGVRAGGGTFEALAIEAFSAATRERLTARFNAARDAEYAEVVERARALQGELEREGGHGKFTFAEVEENEAGLARLRRWLRAIAGRDLFAAGGRGPAEDAVRAAAAALERFAEAAARLEEEPRP